MPLPVLEDIRIASPCGVSWESMKGDGRVRFCGQCRLNVYDLAGMTRADAEALLARGVGEGKMPCVRLWKRADGTVITQDCPRGIARVRRRAARLAVALAGLMLGAIGMGAAAIAGVRGGAAPSVGTGGKVRGWLAGSWAPQLAPPPAPPNVIMGKMVVPHHTLVPMPTPRQSGG